MAVGALFGVFSTSSGFGAGGASFGCAGRAGFSLTGGVVSGATGDTPTGGGWGCGFSGCGTSLGLIMQSERAEWIVVRKAANPIGSECRLRRLHDLLELKRLSIAGQVVRPFLLVRIWKVIIEKLDDLESALVDIKVDISLFEIMCVCLPANRLRVTLLNGEPGLDAEPATLLTNLQEKQV